MVYVPNFLVSLYPAWFNAINFGAVANGSSNPASTRYGTLTALRTVYSFATALTNELDWLALQAAINAAAATNNGGVVYAPAGRYVLSNSNSVSDNSGLLTLPVSTSLGLASSLAVSLRGDFQGTTLSWPNDLGSGKHAILCNANRTDPNYAASSAGYIEDVTLIGPGTSITYGTAPANMMGLGTADRRHLERLNISGFWCGVELVGGQCHHKDLMIQNNYYGYYWQDPRDQANLGNSSTQFGDMMFERCVVQTNAMAAIGVHHAANVAASKFTKCFLGASPYSIYKETNSGSPVNNVALSMCDFELCQFENVGNALISDDTSATSATGRVVAVYMLKLQKCQYMWDYYDGLNFHLPSTSGGLAIIDIGTCEYMDIDEVNNPEQWLPGSLGIFSILTNWGLKLKGDIDTLCSNCAGANGTTQSHNFANGDFQYYNNTVETVGKWKGQIRWLVGPHTNDCVIETSSGIAPCAGTAAEAIAGVCKYTPSTGGSFFNGVIATEGPMTVNTTGTITNYQRLFSSTTAGKCQSGGSGAQLGYDMGNASTNLENCIIVRK